jgi:hypothetical protein
MKNNLITDLGEKARRLFWMLENNPRFDHPAYSLHLERILPETRLVEQFSPMGERFFSAFLSHNTLPQEVRKSSDFTTRGPARFFKSITVDEAGALVSVGLPHFYSLESYLDHPALRDFSKVSFLEKWDGTCLMITKWHNQYLLRSRRQIYDLVDNLACLNLPDYEMGSAMEKLFPPDFAARPFTLATEAIFPHPAIRKPKLSPFYDRVMNGAGFCPYVDHPTQHNVLTNKIYHDGAFARQAELDAEALTAGVKRPATFRFSTLEESAAWLKKKRNSEGFCVYADDDQAVFKYKTHWYSAVYNTTRDLYQLLK